MKTANVFWGLWALAVCLWGGAFPARADGPITRVSLTVEADLKVGDIAGEREISVTPDGGDYEVRKIEVLNENERWAYYDIPEILVELEAWDGSYFELSGSSVRLEGAEYLYGGAGESSGIYRMILRLPPLRGQMGDAADLCWESLTVGAWTPAPNASSYEVRVFRGDRQIGPVSQTRETRFDFGSYMRGEGSYRFQVRAVNAWDPKIKGSWVEVLQVSQVDGAAAEQLRRIYPSLIPEGAEGPGMTEEFAAKAYENLYGWIRDGRGWWYRNGDGSYPAGGWQQIDGEWYFFDSEGYMVTGWIDWNGKCYYCDPDSGRMLVSTLVPDGLGRRVDSTGAMIL